MVPIKLKQKSGQQKKTEISPTCKHANKLPSGRKFSVYTQTNYHLSGGSHDSSPVLHKETRFFQLLEFESSGNLISTISTVPLEVVATILLKAGSFWNMINPYKQHAALETNL